MYRKFHGIQPVVFKICEQTDRQIDRHADTILRTSTGGKVNIYCINEIFYNIIIYYYSYSYYYYYRLLINYF